MTDRPKKTQPPRRRGRIRISKVYTRAGDAGTTRLVGGQVIAKDDARIEAYGTIDELGVGIGEARQAIHLALCFDAIPSIRRLGEHLRYLQNLLFTLGGDLATRPADRWPNMPLIDRTHIDYLERLIDGYNATLPPLEDFILAGGGPVALALHRCRVVCRRAERRLQTLAAAEPTGDFAMPFVNRLSDLFFVLARWAAANARFDAPPEAEAIWDRKLKPPPPPRASRRAKK